MQASASVTGVPPIPAMTTDAERECYYRLVREGAGKGEIVELGAWLGASTAYIAAALRDAGVTRKAHVYDKFEVKPSHQKKIAAFYGDKEPPKGPSLDQYRANLGPLLDFIETHPGQIEQLRWRLGKMAVLISDAPKRVPAISSVLTTFRGALEAGSVMAWQDFCHFPSYEISACLFRLRKHLEFTEAVLPGSTMVFRVKSRWEAKEVTRAALTDWTPTEIEAAWEYWSCFVPQEKASLFRCGQAMFLADEGHMKEAVAILDRVLSFNDRAVLAKWEYLRGARPDFFVRYRPLFDCFAAYEKKAA